jgi:hypothetical protein
MAFTQKVGDGDTARYAKKPGLALRQGDEATVKTDHRQRMCRLLDFSDVLQNDNSLIRSDCAFPG